MKKTIKKIKKTMREYEVGKAPSTKKSPKDSVADAMKASVMGAKKVKSIAVGKKKVAKDLKATKLHKKEEKIHEKKEKAFKVVTAAHAKDKKLHKKIKKTATKK